MTERFLLVQLADIGDLILTTPAIAALREAHPDAYIALLTTSHSAPIIETRLVDELILFDRQQFNSSVSMFKPANLRRIFGLRRSHFDTVIFFHHFTLRAGTFKFALIGFASGAKRRIGLNNGNGWFLSQSLPDGGFGARHQAEYWLELVGLAGASSEPRNACVNVGTLPEHLDHKAKKRVVIHAGSGGYSLARRWSPQKFAQVADQLQNEYQAEIVVVGTKDDDGSAMISAMKSDAIDLVGKTTLPELARTIQSADLYIGADSGVSHVAAAVGTPVVAVFGPSNADAYQPWNPSGLVAIVRSAPECSPCSYVEHGIGLREGCPARTCVRMVEPLHVIHAAKAILDNEQVPLSPSIPEKPGFQRIHILSLPVDGVTYPDWMQLMDEWVKTGDRCYHVCTVNPEFAMIARDDVNFRNILKRADLCIPDGVGILWAAKRQGTPLPERVTGSDGIYVIAEHAEKLRWKLFFLGAGEGIAEEAKDMLLEKYPALQVVGTFAGSPAPEEEDELVAMVNESGADILLVAYGAPKQDKWIARNLPRLQISVAIGVGGTFDFVVGKIPRAPQWMRNVGLEWLYRLIRQPWRIRRMMRLPRFVLAVLFAKD